MNNNHSTEILRQSSGIGQKIPKRCKSPHPNLLKCINMQYLSLVPGALPQIFHFIIMYLFLVNTSY